MPHVLLCRLFGVRALRDHFVEAYTGLSTGVGSRRCCSIPRMSGSRILLRCHSEKARDIPMSAMNRFTTARVAAALLSRVPQRR